MKNKLLINCSTLLTACALVFTSCKKKNDDDTAPLIPADTVTSVFISCEGKFVGGSGTLSIFYTGNNTVQNDIFKTVNGFDLGNVVQSVSLYNGKAYMVVNNANKIEVMNDSTIESSATITGFTGPRYFLGINSTKGYVTQWGTTMGQIKIIDLASNTATGTIDCGYGPEGMLQKGNFVYVCNSGDFVNSDDSITVINTTTDAVETKFYVGKNPSAIVEDANGKLWTICNGTWGNNDGSLVKINPTTNTVEQSFPLNKDYYLLRLAVNKARDKVYFSLGDKTFAQDVNASTLTTTAFVTRSFYSLAADPNADVLYCADARDYNSNGWILRYNSNTAALIDSFEVGIVPGNFFFKK